MIEARGLVKRYGDTVAVAGLTFDVQPGLVTGFLGPNGSGKLLHAELIRARPVLHPTRCGVESVQQPTPHCLLTTTLRCAIGRKTACQARR